MNTKDILNERGKTHGDFTDNARVSQELKDVLKAHPRYHALTAVQAESLDMICHKIARIIAGNPNFEDHWADLAGYATLVIERLESRS